MGGMCAGEQGFGGGFMNRADFDSVRSLATCLFIFLFFIFFVLFFVLRALLTFACIYLFIGLLHIGNGTAHEPRQRTDGAARRSTRRSTAGVNKRGATHLIFAFVPLTRARCREIKVKSICLDVSDVSLHQFPISFDDITNS